MSRAYAPLRPLIGVGLMAALGALAAAPPLTAQVRLEVSSDGSKMIHNHGAR